MSQVIDFVEHKKKADANKPENLYKVGLELAIANLLNPAYTEQIRKQLADSLGVKQ